MKLLNSLILSYKDNSIFGPHLPVQLKTNAI